MRRLRLGLVLLAFYFLLIGGSSYYYVILPVRLFHHYFVTGLLVWWLVSRLRRGEGLPYTPLNPGLYALIAAWLVTSLLGLDARVSLEQTWFLVTHVLLFWVIFDLFQHGRGRLVLEVLFLMAALIVLIGGLQIASWLFGLGITPQTQVAWLDVWDMGFGIPLESLRLWMPLGVSTWLSGFTAPLALVAGVWAATTARRDQRIVLGGLALGLLVVMLLTFSRGGIVSLGAGLGALIVARAAGAMRGGITRRTLPALGVLVAAAGVALVVVFTLSRQPTRIAGDALRVDLWESAVQMIAADPVTGMGPGMFGRALRDFRDPRVADDRMATAHNLYLNTTAEMGLLGIIVGAVLAGLVLRTWWRNWQATAPASPERLRLEAICAALIGVAAHSMVDTFTVTAMVLPFITLLSYSVAGGYRAPVTRAEHPAFGVAALVAVLIYGAWFVQIDRAHLHFQRSLTDSDGAMEAIAAAHSIDPTLRLYDLQAAYVAARRSDPIEAVDLYAYALRSEPTWETGWLNQAAAGEAAGDLAGAVAHLERARVIRDASPAHFHWARLQESLGTASEETIIVAYVGVLRYHPRIAFSAYWAETDVRRRALVAYSDLGSSAQQYRIAAVHAPGMLDSLVPADPQTAADWWVVGEHALTVKEDHEAAVAAFDRAVAMDPQGGDYYAARARARWMIDPVAAERDLKAALLIGTRYEYPNATRALLTDDPARRRAYLAAALPPVFVDQNFEGVLFNRTAQFEIEPAMRLPGPGAAAMSPWYALAADYEATGEIDRARNAYRVILAYAPDESDARDHLRRLESGS